MQRAVLAPQARQLGALIAGQRTGRTVACVDLRLPKPLAQHVGVETKVTGDLAQVADLLDQPHGVGLLLGGKTTTGFLRHRDILAHFALSEVSTFPGEGHYMELRPARAFTP